MGKLISRYLKGYSIPVVLQESVLDLLAPVLYRILLTAYLHSPEYKAKNKAYKEEKMRQTAARKQTYIGPQKASEGELAKRRAEHQMNEAAANFGRALGANHDMTVNEVNQNTLNTANLMGYMVAPYLMTTLQSGYYAATNRPKEAALTAGLGYGLPILFKGMQQLPNTARSYVLSKELNRGIKQSTKQGDIRVLESYFNNPDKWYRVTETPEVHGIEEFGRNVTTRDIQPGTILADSFRRTVGENGLIAGTGENEGYWFLKPERFNMFKGGQAHGNTSQAAKGQIWQGTFAKSGKFPLVVLEGQGNRPTFRGMTSTGRDSRTHFVLLNWEDIPQGARLGFHTGEMPLENLRWFQRNSDGTFTFKGSLLPETRTSFNLREESNIPTLNIQDVLNTKVSLNHVLPKLYVIPNFTSKHGSLAMPSTADTPVGWGNSPVLFLKNSAISKYPHQAYIGDGQVNTVNGVFGRNKDFSNYSLSELRDALNSKMDKVKEVYLPEKSTPTTDENMIFNSKLRRYLSDRNPDAYIGPSYDELHFHSAIPLEDFKYAFLPDYETAPELLSLFDKYGIKTNFDFSDKRGVDLEAFRNWITNNDKDIGFRKGGKLKQEMKLISRYYGK